MRKSAFTYVNYPKTLHSVCSVLQKTSLTISLNNIKPRLAINDLKCSATHSYRQSSKILLVMFIDYNFIFNIIWISFTAKIGLRPSSPRIALSEISQSKYGSELRSRANGGGTLTNYENIVTVETGKKSLDWMKLDLNF